jgi:transcriptional regulator with XRE-family HTH domain
MSTELAQKIGQAARAARQARKLTQADVAERIGTSVEFYARLERGGTLPSVPTLQRLMVALSTSADALLAGTLTIEPVPEVPPATDRDRLLRRVVRKLDEADEPTLGLVNHLLLGVSQLRTEWEAEASRRRRAR